MAAITNFRDGNQNGAVSPPPSEPFRLPGKTQNYRIQLETNIDGGNVKASSITLQKEVSTRSGKDYQGYATSYDGGKNWYEPGVKPLKKISPSTGLTADEIKGLQPGGALNKAVTGASQSIAKKNNASPLQQSQIKQGNDAATSPAEVTGAQVLSSTVAKENTQTRNSFPGAAGSRPLVYPIQLKDDKQDTIKFQMVKYQPKSFSTQTFGFSEREKAGSKNREIIGTVILPIPGGISDTNAVNWGGGEMNAAQAAMAQAALGGIKQGGEGLFSSIEKTSETIAANSGEVKTAVAAAFAEAATGVQGILARTSGLVVNPNLELLFSAPTLRPFTFNFKLSARSGKEAEAIRSIIRFFKQGMAPIKTEGQLFLKAPHTFQIEYRHLNQPHSYLNKFKECALLSCSVDYTPEGQYATFTDGAMVSYQIQMQFQELEPIFNNDYDTDNDASIGY